jgi:hypothetical protein
MSHIFVPQDEVRVLRIDVPRKELQNWLKTIKTEIVVIEIQMKYALEPACFNIIAKAHPP